MLIRVCLAVTFLSPLRAEVKPHALFCDGAVLQQGVPIPVWGMARDREQITLELAGQTFSTTAKDGKWKVEFPALKAGGPHTITIKGDNQIVIKDVLVGEVWLCSGQSNMEFTLVAASTWEAEKSRADIPKLRMFKVKRQVSDEPAADVTGSWLVCTPENAAKFSAVGYFMGRDLHAATGVPVGIINSTKGGTWAQAWVSLQGYESSGNTNAVQKIREYAAGYPRRLAEFPAKQKAYEAAVAEWKKTDGPAQEKALKDWKAKSDASAKARQPFTEPQLTITIPKPTAPDAPEGGPNGYSVLFNGMIAPLAPYPFKGVAWYQGESNCNAKGAPLYRGILSTLVGDWRRHFGRPDLPFLIVQLPAFKSNLPKIREAQLHLPEIREAQLLTVKKSPPAAVIVTTDVGDTNNLHPPNKEPVGARLALAARGIAYGEPFEYSGPMYDSMKVEGNRVVLTFTHVGKGLVAKDGPLKGFTIASQDGVFVVAKASIEGSTVVVSADGVSAPVAVRYGWDTVPDINLYNREGLPASPFRTDSAKPLQSPTPASSP